MTLKATNTGRQPDREGG